MTVRKNISSIIWGLVLLALGVLFLGNNLEIWNIDVFFTGWWTLFIIIPSLIGLFKKESVVASSIFLLIGISLLLSCYDIDIVNVLFFPFLLIIIGLSCIFSFNKVKNFKKRTDGTKEIIGVFSGAEERIVDEFDGARCVAVFGGIELDLRKAKLKNEVVIDCVTVFGGIDIRVPDNVKVVTNGIPIFGGIENRSLQEIDDKKITIYVNCVCIFAGIEIK